MTFQRVGLNLSKLQDIEPYNSSSLNIPTNGNNIFNYIVEKANDMASFNGTSYLGLTLLTTLFIYLVISLRDFDEYRGDNYSTLRSVGISGGICAIIGLQMLNIGYFTEYYHVVIFMGIHLVAWIWIWFDK